MRKLILRYKVNCKINKACYFFILKSNILFNIDNRDYGHYRHSTLTENCNVAQKKAYSHQEGGNHQYKFHSNHEQF